MRSRNHARGILHGLVVLLVSAVTMLLCAVAGVGMASAAGTTPQRGEAGVDFVCGPNVENYGCDLGGYSGHDSWGYAASDSYTASGVGHNCTTYVAFRLKARGVQDPGAFGNAKYWADGANKAHIPVDQSPTVGAVAQWTVGAKGHVAMVEAVDAGSITITDDNFFTDDDHKYPALFGGYDDRIVIQRTSDAWPQNFIHFPNEPQRAPTSGPVQFLGHIVHWANDTSTQRMSWIVVARDGKVSRDYIPTTDIYWCLKRQGHPGPDTFSDDQMRATPENGKHWATCDASAKPGGQGGGDPGGVLTGQVEQAGHYGARVFTNYHTASGEGVRVGVGQQVSVACKVLDHNIASAGPDGYWYQLASDPWNGQYYAPANAFMNGDPWGGPYSHNTDFNVPDCGKVNDTSDGTTSLPPVAVGNWLEQQGHRGASTFSNVHSASGVGAPVAAGQYVRVSCKVLDGSVPSVNPDGYWYRLADSPWNDQMYAAANTFMNGDPWGGPYGHNTDFNVPDCAGPVVVGGGGGDTPPPNTTPEVEGHYGVHTFANVHNASGLGADIAPGATVHVNCKVLDTTIASVNPDGYWYQIADSPWSGNYYSPANTFMNGDPIGGPYTHNTDFGVPDCGSNPPPPPPPATTYAETTGGVTHTWTDYNSAGGQQGPSIASNQTVQIACKVIGFTVADGNTNWYKVASDPWNSAFYASADAFYNNGATSGSLRGTPFADPAVPDCGSNPPPPPPPATTYAETTGGVTHTWTDYNSAGGQQGPSIASNQTVQIACKLPGFRVADGNTWWYRIASDPWNDAFYASADAFYNNGSTSGPLLGTPYVDPNVRDC